MKRPHPALIVVTLFSALMLAATPTLSGAKPPDPGTPASVATTVSVNRQYLAVTDPKQEKTTVYRVGKSGQKQELWHLRGNKIRPRGISDDGQYLVSSFGHAVPAHFKSDMAVLIVYHQGKPYYHLRLWQLFPKRPTHKGSAPFVWGSYEGFDATGNFWIRTSQGRRIGLHPAKRLLTYQ